MHSTDIMSETVIGLHGVNEFADIECKFSEDVSTRLRGISAGLRMEKTERGFKKAEKLKMYSHGVSHEVAASVLHAVVDKDVEDLKRLLKDIKTLKDPVQKKTLFDRWYDAFSQINGLVSKEVVREREEDEVDGGEAPGKSRRTEDDPD